VLNFIDDTQVRVKGLDEIMADLNFHNSPANDTTVEEIIRRLEGKKNYIPSSDRARKEYTYVLLKEYRKYVKDHGGGTQ
jgi:hypothetical protein